MLLQSGSTQLHGLLRRSASRMRFRRLRRPWGSLVRQRALWQHSWSGYQPDGDGAKASIGPDLAPDVQAKMDKMQEKIRTLQSQRDRAVSPVDQGKSKGQGKCRWADQRDDGRFGGDCDDHDDEVIKRRRR